MGAWLLLSLVIFVMGLAGLPDDLKTWSVVIDENEGAFRLISVLIGLFMFYIVFSQRINSFFFPRFEPLTILPEAHQSQTADITSGQETTLNSPDLVPREEHESLKEEVKGLKASVDKEASVQKGLSFLTEGEDSITESITPVDVEHAKLSWFPPETIRGELVSSTEIRFERRASSSGNQPVDIDWTVED